ncbi:TPC2 protein, partial [Corythaixoides concolor]|nr:TPC2 protein [Corythaixoides concolor]
TRTTTCFFIFLNLSLAVFEEPAVYPLPFLVTSSSVQRGLALLLVALSQCPFDLHHRGTFPTLLLGIFLLLQLSLTDLAVYGVLRIYNIRSIRWSKIVRPIFLINFAESRQIRRAFFHSIHNTLPKIIYIFLLFMFSLLIFSLMALKLFGERNLQMAEGLPYFRNYLEIVFDLNVLVTTANSLDVMMPAFDFSSWYALFFIAFVIVNTYIFMSLFLAVVYNNYKKHLKVTFGGLYCD